MQHSVVLIAGATASGKSALAVDLAVRLGGVVINADAMQVYRELDVLTARPGRDDLARVRHLLYGHVPAHRRYSVGAWLADLGAALEEARAAGEVPVIVGGTGLYFKAATEGLVPLPPIPAAIRAGIAGRLADEGLEALFLELSRLDPVGAGRLQRSDRTRIVRALEVLTATGRPLHVWQTEARAQPLVDPARALKLVVAVPPAELAARIARRCRQMAEAGAIAEAAALAGLGLDENLPAMKAIGVGQLAAVSRGELDLEAALERMAAETRRYAKRQRTWFRHQISGWRELPSPEPAAAARELAGLFAALVD